MKDYATIIAVSGVVVLGLGTLILTGITKQVLDTELMKQIVTGLIGFASGVGVTMAVSK